MPRTREVGTLWIGGPLSWMEQLCLKSFVDKGQKITLFSYEDIPNVPEGVIRRDGREIIDTDDFIKYEQKNSYALFADWFRLHMIHQNPGMIWIDTDVYCHRPMDYDGDYVFGFELPGEQRVNNAVLGMPADSNLLKQMLEFTDDRYSIAPFLPKKRQAEMQKKADKGRPVHISEQPWGVWGPMMVTYYVHKLGLQDKVQPLNAFYPITFRDRTKFMRQASIAEGLITEDTTALHLWASNKRQLGNLHDGLPPKGSYLKKLVREHDIMPALAPIKGRGYTTFDGALIDHLDLKEVTSVADIAGTARSFVLALHHKFDCDIYLVNTNRRAKFKGEDQPWLAPYITFLTENEVDPDRIKVIRSEADLRAVDVLCNLQGFGHRWRTQFLETFLKRCVHSDTRIFMDVRKGSGAFPFLKPFGTNIPIATREEDEVSVTRICVFPKPPEVEEDDASWDQIAAGLAGENGWYRPGPNGHSFLFMPRDPDTLVVTFDNLDIAMTKREDRRPWGYSFIEDQGWSMLGVLAGGWTWYREPWVCDQFDDLKASGFFKQFKRVVFYGASMGGYAACAFSPAAPGCDVVAISPQSTVDKSVVPWETRYKVVWDRDFTGPYGDAAEVSKSARRVSILYDPYEPLDAQHAARFIHPNVQHLRAPLLGHRLGSSLNQMGILSPIILGALNGTLTSEEFYRMLRKRRDFPRYQRELFNRAVEKGHTSLAKMLGEFILNQNPNRAVRLGMKALG
ncbi:hypothetical protein [Marivita hallyeonensis]|uniref:Uncharacterized protein n=1 Tax=Marivita hallyeonensis TaxID=996342 RepID=A0A1M5U5N7_9RHOB|nr:hypothetical protein [Marivita hallyeonensis]SHH58166.1 hypothetical protein SAMN05443551_2494 [Marivita hallyeonensis]